MLDPETFYQILSSSSSTVEFLRALEVLPQENSVVCTCCNYTMKDKFKKRKDGHESLKLRCNRCKTETSLLKNTFLLQKTKTGYVRNCLAKQFLKSHTNISRKNARRNYGM
jgi:uncharacterized paraquat-inducible protein A